MNKTNNCGFQTFYFNSMLCHWNKSTVAIDVMQYSFGVYIDFFGKKTFGIVLTDLYLHVGLVATDIIWVIFDTGLFNKAEIFEDVIICYLNTAGVRRCLINRQI